VESKLGSLGTSATEWPIVAALGNYDDDGEIGGMKICRGNRSTYWYGNFDFRNVANRI
jgi:hypothetical protein